VDPARGGLLGGIVAFAVRFRGVVLALAVLLVVYGVYVLLGARYDVFPEFAPPQVVLQTEAPGLAPEQVEALVTRPIESALNGAPGVESLRSTSIQGLSVVTVLFDPRTDVTRDRQVVAERLAEIAGRLPRGVSAPGLTPLTSSTSTVLIVGLTSEERSLMELRTLADWTLRPQLLAVPGVAKVTVFGGEVRQIQVQVHPDRLVRHELGMDEVVDAARRATGIRGAGFIETANQRVVLQTEGQPVDARGIAETVVAAGDAGVVRLADVADVVDAPEPPVGAAAIDGVPGVDLMISQQYGANTLEVTRHLEDALARLRPLLEAQRVTLHPALFRPASFVETATRGVRSALLVGGALVVIVLFLFLYDFRVAAISCTAIPLSLLAAVVVLDGLGHTLNTMTLGGLAIAIGEVVDDAVIDVENVLRRLRENRQRDDPRPAARVVLDASLEVRSPVVYATLAVILVFFPVLTLSGIAGRLFAPLGLAYVFAVLASLVVALTVTPALAMLLLSARELGRREPPLLRWSKGRYLRLLRRIEERPRPVLVATVAASVAALGAVPFLGTSFLPELKEGHFILHMSAVPGTSLVESLRLGRLVSSELGTLGFVRSVAQHAGRAEKADDVWGTHYSEIEVDLEPLGGEQAEEAPARIRAALAPIPGVSFALNTFLTERVEETLSGYVAPVVVYVHGDDLDVLDREAHEAARVLRTIEGARDVHVPSPGGTPRLGVRLRPGDVGRFGLDAVHVLEAVETAYQGLVTGQVHEAGRVVDVAVILDPEARNSLGRVGELPIRTPAGRWVRLREVADVYEAGGRSQVQHQGSRRVQVVTADVEGRDVASFVREARARLARLSASGASFEVAGTAEAEARSRRDLLLHSLIAAVGIVLLLSAATGSARNLLLVLANLPFALVGGVLAAVLTGGELSLGSMVGFVTLCGITLRNSILMVSHYEHLVGVEGRPWGIETAVFGASDRLAPIVMTSLVTALGLLPLAVAMDEPGREIEGPMAVVILGGLLTSMVLNLLVLPAVSLRFGRFGRGEPVAG
jgi:CzcA family heavy metal efflux pump